MSNEDLKELARYRRRLHLWGLFAIACGLAGVALTFVFDAPTIVKWLTGFLLGALVAMVGLSWWDKPNRQ
jgi:hypothetical protein